MKGLLIGRIKVSDSVELIKVLTSDHGLIHLFNRNSSKKNKSSSRRIQLFQEFEFILQPSKNNTTKAVQEIDSVTSFNSITEHPIKRAMLFFFSDVLTNAIHEGDSNSRLYDFVMNQLEILEQKEGGFHEFVIGFLFGLMDCLGIIPHQITEEDDLLGLLFDPLQGIFDNPQSTSFSDKESMIMTKYLRFIYLNATLELNHEERAIGMDLLVKYFRYHLPAFKQLKSIEIIKECIS